MPRYQLPCPQPNMITASEHHAWRRDEYLISTDSSMIPIFKLNELFASDEFYWANSMTAEAMRHMLDNSLTFGLYQSQCQSLQNSTAAMYAAKDQFIGIARCVTDRTTFLYLTDVFVEPAFQGRGLGTWLVSCVQEVIASMPYIRRSMLFTGNWEKTVPLYEKVMGMSVVETKKGEGMALMIRRGPGAPRTMP